MRGIIKEVLSLIAFIAAFLAALNWGPAVAAYVHPLFSFHPLLLSALSYVLVFVLTLLIVGMLNVFLTTIIEKTGDRKSTRLNSSHVAISYAVFCLKKKKKNIF